MPQFRSFVGVICDEKIMARHSTATQREPGDGEREEDAETGGRGDRVLNSERAIELNITIMRAFVKLRQMLETNEELNRKFAAVMRNCQRTTNISEWYLMNSRS